VRKYQQKIGGGGIAYKHKQDTVLLGEDGIGATANLTGDVLENVFPEHIFDLLGLETTLDDQALVSVDGTARTQLGKQKLEECFFFFSFRWWFLFIFL